MTFYQRKRKFYHHRFDEDYVKEIKKKSKKKTIELGNFNNLNKEVETRYVGYLGEDAFENTLEDLHIGYHRYSNIDDMKTDEADFRVGRHLVDVKTISTKYYPKTDYACNVMKAQHDRNATVTAYVFVRYILKENLADEIYVYIAAKILGSKGSTNITDQTAQLTQTLDLQHVDIKPFDNDIRLTGLSKHAVDEILVNKG